MVVRYYRVTPKKHPEWMGIYIRQSDKGLEIIAGEDESLKGFKVRGERLVSSNPSLLIRNSSRKTAMKAKSDYEYIFGMTACCGPAPSPTGKAYPGGLY